MKRVITIVVCKVSYAIGFIKGFIKGIPNGVREARKLLKEMES